MHRVHVMEGPLAPWEPMAFPEAGAVVAFDGVVRPLEDGRVLEALAYEAYRPMADRQLEHLAAEAVTRQGLIACLVWHSVGRVAVGETSFRLVVASAHRREALAAMDWFIDVMKKDVPIWKRPVWRA
ncbi:MAG: molybdenum cofactor biosynthesis protein MoaE [Phycisphaerae bacterium]|jgi:molybdopterin synthase catalytic subunit